MSGCARRGMKPRRYSGRCPTMHQDRRARCGQGRQGRRVKYATARPYADPEKAARRIIEIAHAVEPIQGRIHIEKINESFLFRDRGSPTEYGAGLKLAIERGWLTMHESGTFVTFTSAGAELFA
jgi:hypothetical protein